jgi:DNA-binding NarL/FixJ family response regulator
MQAMVSYEPLVEETPIRIVIVDDHPLLQEGTRALLARSAGIVVAGMAGDGETALRLVEQCNPDVLLLDLHLPGISGVDVARQTRARNPQVAILVLTGYDEIGYVRGLVQLGVRGYLRKSASGPELLAAIRAVAAGQTVLPPAITRTMINPKADLLTARECEVLTLLADGRRNLEIAQALGVSLKTVEFHISHILDKLGARSRTEAIFKARQQGFSLLEENRTLTS